MFDVVTFLNPVSSTSTVYLPVGICGAVYSPAESVVTVRVRPVAVCVSVTVAPGMTAPVVSVTVPRMVPVTAWPKADDAVRTGTRTMMRKTRQITEEPRLSIALCLQRSLMRWTLPSAAGHISYATADPQDVR